jgi:hypothetical protein
MVYYRRVNMVDGMEDGMQMTGRCLIDIRQDAGR